MDKIFTLIRSWLASLLEAGPAPDPVDALSLHDYADLPVRH